MKKLHFLIAAILITTGALLYHKFHNKSHNKPIPIIYDKTCIEKLVGFKGYKNLVFKKVGEIKNPPATLLHCWENEAGDFTKTQIKLSNNRIVEYDNSSGWIKVLEKSEPLYRAVADYLRVPKNSQKIHKQPYCITLDMPLYHIWQGM